MNKEQLIEIIREETLKFIFEASVTALPGKSDISVLPHKGAHVWQSFVRDVLDHDPRIGANYMDSKHINIIKAAGYKFVKIVLFRDDGYAQAVPKYYVYYISPNHTGTKIFEYMSSGNHWREMKVSNPTEQFFVDLPDSADKAAQIPNSNAPQGTGAEGEFEFTRYDEAIEEACAQVVDDLINQHGLNINEAELDHEVEDLIEAFKMHKQGKATREIVDQFKTDPSKGHSVSAEPATEAEIDALEGQFEAIKGKLTEEFGEEEEEDITW
tara:strand:+ start:5184 stop:5990 length:807 start_codon:yes stop_codon:yes gene_type:complete